MINLVCDFRDERADVFRYLVCHGGHAQIDGRENGRACDDKQPVVLRDEADDLRYGYSEDCDQHKRQDVHQLPPRRVGDKFLDEKAVNKGDEMVVDRYAADHENNAVSICQKYKSYEFQFMENRKAEQEITASAGRHDLLVEGLERGGEEK